MKRACTEKGFTLTEVAFSIAIIGLAVVVSMAVFAAGIKTHNQTTLRMVAAATTAYLMDHGLGQDFAKSDARPSDSLLRSLPDIVIPLSQVNNTTWEGVALNLEYDKLTLENPGGGSPSPIDATNAGRYFVLKSPKFGNPAANLIFAESTIPTTGTGNRWNKLSVWGCDWRNKPKEVSMRAPLLVEFMYYDYSPPTL
jgi:type II secretory pathway pseudopilin PulG